MGCGCGFMACELSMACACEYGWGRLARQRPLLCVVFSAAECARAIDGLRHAMGVAEDERACGVFSMVDMLVVWLGG